MSPKTGVTFIDNMCHPKNNWVTYRVTDWIDWLQGQNIPQYILLRAKPRSAAAQGRLACAAAGLVRPQDMAWTGGGQGDR